MYLKKDCNGNVRKYYESFLYCCALDSDNCEKLHRYSPDVCVVDIEDSVPPHRKDEARSLASQFFTTAKDYTTGIRINTIRTLDGIKDIAALVAMEYPPNVIFLSKTTSATEVEIVRSLFKERDHKECPEIYPLIELPAAILSAQEIASVSDGFLFGAADYATYTGCEYSWENTLYARRILIAAAWSVGIPCIESTSFAIKDCDREQLELDVTRAKEIGYTGMAAIHPKQIELIKDIFKPSENDINQARDILSSYQSNGQFEIKSGQVIGPPFLKSAMLTMKKAGFELEET